VNTAAEQLAAAGRRILGNGGGGLVAAPAGMLVMSLGLGGLLVGLVALFLDRRDEQESAPPAWVRLACVLGLLPWIAGNPAAGPASPWMPVLAGLGLVDRAARRAHGEGGLRRLLAVQVLVALLVALAFEGSDPLDSWRHRARWFLEPGDRIVTMQAEHAYLARERWGIETELLPPLFDQPADRLGHEDFEKRLAPELRRAGGRVVLDGAPDSFPVETRGLWEEIEAEVLGGEAPRYRAAPISADFLSPSPSAPVMRGRRIRQPR
jgi:hypothetical protein